MRLCSFAITFLLFFSWCAFAAEPSPVVIELFTSEGCSSCPPADQFVAELVAANAPGRPEVIALGEHVDYWNHDGWTDRFSSRQYTDRQNTYAQKFKLQSPYTPQIVVDGAQQVEGNDKSAVVRAILAASQQPPAAKVDLHLNPNSQLAVQVESSRPSGDIFLAITEDGLKTDVRAGENNGHRLTHVAVVRRLDKIGSVSKGAFSKEINLPIDKSWDPQHTKAVVFVQEKNAGAIIGAASVPLSAQPTTTAAR